MRIDGYELTELNVIKDDLLEDAKIDFDEFNKSM